MRSEESSKKTYRVVSVNPDTDGETETWVRAPSRQSAAQYVDETYANETVASAREWFAVGAVGSGEWIAAADAVDIEL